MSAVGSVQASRGRTGSSKFGDAAHTTPLPGVTTLVIVVITALTLFGWMLSFATRDAGPRIHRPGVDDSASFSVQPLFGFHGWPYVFEIGAVAAFAAILITLTLQCVRQRKITMGMLFFVAGNGLVWLDPWGNWGPYATYDARLLHWPETWWWASVSPTIEPVFNFVGYYGFYIGPSALAILLQKRVIGARFDSHAFIHRHPLITLTAVTVVMGFVIDAIVEIFFVKTGLYGYSQVPSFGSINVGRVDQFPLLLESLSTTFPFVAVSLLWWRDDTGLTGAERLAARFRVTRMTGRFGVFMLMFAVMSFGYFCYLAPFFTIRYLGLSSEVARPWRWCVTKVYDPQGRFEKQGEQGPFYAGMWSTWPSGQPGGRRVAPPLGKPLPDACAP